MKNSGIFGPTPTGVNHRRLQISKYLASVTLKPPSLGKRPRPMLQDAADNPNNRSPLAH